MAKPLPSPEYVKIRTTVSLPAWVKIAADAYRKGNPLENLKDFSAVVTEALVEYIKIKHPELLKEAIASLRKNPMNYEQAEEHLLAVAEERPPKANHPEQSAELIIAKMAATLQNQKKKAGQQR